MSGRQVLDVADASPGAAEACRVLHDAGYRLLRHLALELQEGGLDGCIALVRHLGYTGQNVNEIATGIFEECSENAKGFEQ